MADAAPRRVLVTGGARGLGAAIVRALAAAGHDVTFTYRSGAAEAEALLSELDAAHAGRAFAAATTSCGMERSRSARFRRSPPQER